MIVIVMMLVIVSALVEDDVNERATHEGLIEVDAAAVCRSQNLTADAVSGEGREDDRAHPGRRPPGTESRADQPPDDETHRDAVQDDGEREGSRHLIGCVRERSTFQERVEREPRYADDDREVVRVLDEGMRHLFDGRGQEKPGAHDHEKNDAPFFPRMGHDLPGHEGRDGEVDESVHEPHGLRVVVKQAVQQWAEDRGQQGSDQERCH